MAKAWHIIINYSGKGCAVGTNSHIFTLIVREDSFEGAYIPFLHFPQTLAAGELEVKVSPLIFGEGVEVLYPPAVYLSLPKIRLSDDRQP